MSKFLNINYSLLACIVLGWDNYIKYGQTCQPEHVTIITSCLCIWQVANFVCPYPGSLCRGNQALHSMLIYYFDIRAVCHLPKSTLHSPNVALFGSCHFDHYKMLQATCPKHLCTLQACWNREIYPLHPSILHCLAHPKHPTLPGTSSDKQ